MFRPTQIKTTVTPNTFTAQDAGIYSNAELNQFRNRVFLYSFKDWITRSFTKLSTTLQP